jgi:signal transduction histidine kinase
MIDGGASEALLPYIRQATQWQTLGALLPTLAHDVRAPLNALVINLELLRELLKPGADADAQNLERRERSLGALSRAVAQLRTTLDSLIGMAKEPEENAADFDLSELARQVAALVRPLAQLQRVALREEIPAEKILVRGSPGRHKQAALHLTLRGLAAMPAGGDLVLGLTSDAAKAVLSVVDTGVVVPTDAEPAAADRLFGGDVGLYVARATVEVHGGSLKIDSHEARGTRAELALPLAQGGR